MHLHRSIPTLFSALQIPPTTLLAFCLCPPHQRFGSDSPDILPPLIANLELRQLFPDILVLCLNFYDALAILSAFSIVVR